jgi:hypothetical protein
MADLECNYYGVGAQPVTSGRWFKAAAAILGGSSLVILGLASTQAAYSAPQAAVSASAGTSLYSLARPQSGLAMRNQQGLRYAPPRRAPISAAAFLQEYGQDPMVKLAVTAINGNSRLNRDVSRRAAEEVKEELKAAAEGAEVKINSMTQETMAEATKTVLKAQDMSGVTAPLGFFDPLGFSTDCKEGKLLFYREAELKHGRVGMLASLGFLVGENFHPLFGGNIDVPSYVAFQQTPLQTFWGAVVFAIAQFELFSVFTFVEPNQDNDSLWAMRSDRTPGNLGFDPLGLRPKDPKEFKEMQTKELNNGRLAMIAAAGMIAQELATGKKLF